MKKILCVLLVLVLAIDFSSCSARRIKKDMTGAEDSRVAAGRVIFKNNCQKCHPNGESGVGPPLNNIYLPGFLMRARVRSRAFLLWTGRMPSFKKHEISKKEMDDLIVYLKDMKHKKK